MLIFDPAKTPSLARRVNFTLPAELEAHEPARGARLDPRRRAAPGHAPPGRHRRPRSLPRPARLRAARLGRRRQRLGHAGRPRSWLAAPTAATSASTSRPDCSTPSGWSSRASATWSPARCSPCPAVARSPCSPRGPARSASGSPRCSTPLPVFSYLYRYGKPIAYSYVRGEWPLAAYQTVYAARPGSAEMPSAGRAFTWDVIDRLRARGVTFATLTLHTGVASLEDHEPPYEEWFQVPAATADAVNAAHDWRPGGDRCGHDRRARAGERRRSRRSGRAHVRLDRLVVTPERGVRAVDGLLTGFHEPQA